MAVLSHRRCFKSKIGGIYLTYFAITDSRYYGHKLKVPRVSAIAGVDCIGKTYARRKNVGKILENEEKLVGCVAALKRFSLIG